MAQTLTPTSTKLTASASTWSDYIDALDTHFGGSSIWNVDLSNSDGSNNRGIAIVPDTTPQGFSTNYQLNIRYDASSGYLYAAIDPNGNITDPLDPTGTGSSEVSSESRRAGPSGPSYNTEFLLAEWDDAIGILWKDTGNAFFENWLLAGNIHDPYFPNDPDHNIDGLGWSGSSPQIDTNVYGDQDSGTSASEAHSPDGWFSLSVKRYDDITTIHPWNNNNHPAPHSLETATQSNSTGNRRALGEARYTYVWNSQSGGSGFTRLDSGTGDGFIFLSRGSDVSSLMPWDPSVSPS